MARETITRFVSDLSGEDLDERSAYFIRISKPVDPQWGSVVLDVAEDEVAAFLEKGKKEKPRGRAAKG